MCSTVICFPRVVRLSLSFSIYADWSKTPGRHTSVCSFVSGFHANCREIEQSDDCIHNFYCTHPSVPLLAVLTRAGREKPTIIIHPDDITKTAGLLHLCVDYQKTIVEQGLTGP